MRLDYMSCEPYRVDETRYLHLITVTKCPMVHHSVYKTDCEVHNHTLRHIVPVFSDDHIFRNIFCAYCYNEAAKSPVTNLFSLEVMFSCDSGYIKQYEEILRHLVVNTSADMLLHLISEHCNVSYTSKDLSLWHRVFVSCDPGTINECKDSLRDIIAEYSFYKTLCNSYQSEIVEMPDYNVYKNIHCAFCNGVTGTENMTCVDKIDRFTPPVIAAVDFAILLDFSMQSQVQMLGQKMCTGLQYLEVNTGQCIDLTCNASSVECAHISKSIISDEKTIGHEVFSLIFFIAFRTVRNNTNPSLIPWCEIIISQIHTEAFLFTDYTPDCELITEGNESSSVWLSLFSVHERKRMMHDYAHLRRAFKLVGNSVEQTFLIIDVFSYTIQLFNQYPREFLRPNNSKVKAKDANQFFRIQIDSKFCVQALIQGQKRIFDLNSVLNVHDTFQKKVIHLYL